jgi:putative membrane protein
MPPAFKSFLQRWLVNTLAMLVVVKLVKVNGIHFSSNPDLLIAALTLAFLNAFLRPLLLLLSLPLLIFTLGLFTLVINAILLYFAGNLWNGFHVDSFHAAFWGALIISIVSIAVNTLTGAGGSRIQVRRGNPPKRPGDNDKNDGDGPVIDV